MLQESLVKRISFAILGVIGPEKMSPANRVELHFVAGDVFLKDHLGESPAPERLQGGGKFIRASEKDHIARPRGVNVGSFDPDSSVAEIRLKVLRYNRIRGRQQGGAREGNTRAGQKSAKGFPIGLEGRGRVVDNGRPCFFP